MATAAVATISESPANSCWRFSFVERRPSLTARGSFSLDRRPSAPECRVSYKSDDKLRRRNSWRWSWKNVLTRPFQNHSGTRGGSFREKDKNGKKNSPPRSAKNAPKDPVEARMQMANLLRMWYTDADSSDDSSDDDGESSCQGRKRQCGPRVLGNEFSSSGEEEDKWMEQEEMCDGQVSLYVSEGPSSSMDTEAKGSAQRTPESGNPDDTGESSETNSNLGLRRRAPEREQPAVPVNSNPSVLTGVQDTINHDGVISPLQICDLERFVDIKNQVEHSCSNSCERCDGQSCVHVEERCVDDGGEKSMSGGAIHEAGGTRCAAWMSAQSGGESVVKPALGGDLSSSCLEGSIESGRNDGLSAAMQNAEHSERRREELIEGSLDEDIGSVGMQQRKKKGEERVRVSDEMEDLFSSQDLNAIRRFLGMSLQQINANKVLESGGVKVRGSILTIVILVDVIVCTWYDSCSLFAGECCKRLFICFSVNYILQDDNPKEKNHSVSVLVVRMAYIYHEL